MAALQGIDVGMGYYAGRFLVPGDHPPLSGVDPANQAPNAFNLGTQSWGAWLSGGHRFVIFGGKYFDPTFGFIGNYNPVDAGSLLRKYGENLLGYLGDTEPDSSGTYYIMKNGSKVGIFYDSDPFEYRMFV